ncbi:hypothetical protein V8G54_000439 [Vigna mungo]|uniref:Cyanobacterial aminoacyl-tRNA synthetase CAAD domain-containing protein n=1 Tax=Vigna mungo TaxID=3915 RepID=A0AAQ3P6H9_VIGMU
MASIVASLLPPLLLPSTNSQPGSFPTFPVSLLSVGLRFHWYCVVFFAEERVYQCERDLPLKGEIVGIQILDFHSAYLTGRQSNVSLVVKASRESAESSTSLTVFKSVQNVVSYSSHSYPSCPSFKLTQKWDQPEDRLGLFGLGFAAVAAFWASTNLVAAIDKLPLFPAVFELIGIFYSVVSAVLHN